jgi:hypothetical protein
MKQVCTQRRFVLYECISQLYRGSRRNIHAVIHAIYSITFLYHITLIFTVLLDVTEFTVENIYMSKIRIVKVRNELKL